MNFQNNFAFKKKTTISTANLLSIPKSTDNTRSHRLIYKKPAINSENELINAPQQNNKIVRPRVLKTTTPYKSEKIEFIKKFSEKEMNFEDINNFKVIYKCEENEKNKLPAIVSKINSGQSGQINLNNTFNPFNQSIKSKINLENKEFTFTEKNLSNNSSNKNLNMNPKQISNFINKTNVMNEYFHIDKTAGDQQQDKKLNKIGKLDPINLNEGTLMRNVKQKMSSEKNKFPKEIFFANIPKKYIV